MSRPDSFHPPPAPPDTGGRKFRSLSDSRRAGEGPLLLHAGVAIRDAAPPEIGNIAGRALRRIALAAAEAAVTGVARRGNCGRRDRGTNGTPRFVQVAAIIERAPAKIRAELREAGIEIAQR